MTETLVELQPAVILQMRTFRETSVILELFTRDYGIVAVLAKGVRKARSKMAGLLQPFKELLVSYLGRSDLKTLTHVELAHQRPHLDGWGIYCGFYINELVSRFLHKQDPHPEVYADYQDCLLSITESMRQYSIEQENSNSSSPGILRFQNSSLEVALRVFEINLMQHVGFGLPTEYDITNQSPIKESAQYFFQVDSGPVEHQDGTVSGKTLLALSTKQFSDIQTLAEAKQVMRHVINFHLNGRPLKSRTIISKIQQQL
jgi:DNA repair protein RecO (recombination protein O)